MKNVVTVDGTMKMYVMDEENKMSKDEILEDRKRREHDLIGKYVVTTNSMNDAKTQLFLQDKEYGSGYWTKFLSNAKAYYDDSAAVIKARNLYHNNPRVLLVLGDGRFKEVYRNGKRTR